ncbi:MAG TPA: DUF2569 domain-containing protein [Pseudomonadales bacterium]
MQTEAAVEIETVEKPEALKIRGWLILVAAGVIITPLRAAYVLWSIYLALFTDGTWAALTTEGSSVYSPFWAPILIAEIVVNAAVGLAFLYMIFLFFAKKASFPKWYAVAAIFSAAFIVLDSYAVTWIFPGTPVFDSETTKEFGRSLVSCLIWVPYLFLSKRAKATFINK